LQTQILRIGTRGSPLALAQAHEVRDRLRQAHGLPAEAIAIHVIKTSGDRIEDRPLSEAGGKGLFTKEIEEALLAGSIDLAVHSMKDMPTRLPDGLAISCILPREDVRDAFLSLKAGRLGDLPAGAVLGTSSLRRQAQVLHARPDLRIVPFRGNVETRLRKLAEGIADATLLACAGLNRLGLADRIQQSIEPGELLPAVAQGAIGIEIRSGDERVAALLSPLNDQRSHLEIVTERAFLARLEGSCRTPIAGLARLEHGRLQFRGQILLPDGSKSFATERSGQPQDAIRMGEDAAAELLGRAGPEFFSHIAGPHG